MVRVKIERDIMVTFNRFYETPDSHINRLFLQEDASQEHASLILLQEVNSNATSTLKLLYSAQKKRRLEFIPSTLLSCQSKTVFLCFRKLTTPMNQINSAKLSIS